MTRRLTTWFTLLSLMMVTPTFALPSAALRGGQPEEARRARDQATGLEERDTVRTQLRTSLKPPALAPAAGLEEGARQLTAMLQEMANASRPLRNAETAPTLFEYPVKAAGRAKASFVYRVTASLDAPEYEVLGFTVGVEKGVWADRNPDNELFLPEPLTRAEAQVLRSVRVAVTDARGTRVPERRWRNLEPMLDGDSRQIGGEAIISLPSGVRPGAAYLALRFFPTAAGSKESWEKKLPRQPVWLPAEEARQFLDALLEHEALVSVGYVRENADLDETNTVDVVRGARRGAFLITHLLQEHNEPDPFPIRAGDRLFVASNTGLTFVSGSAGVSRRLWGARRTTARALLKTLGVAGGLEEGVAEPVRVDFSQVYATKAAEAQLLLTLSRLLGAKPGQILRPPQELSQLPQGALVAYDGESNHKLAKEAFPKGVVGWDVSHQSFETPQAFFLWFLQALGHPVSAIREIRWSEDRRTAEVFA